MNQKLNISEIYASIQGEAAFAGYPCVFVRTTGCPLRCRWCDTVYAFDGGEVLDIQEICKRISEFGISLVELTGGEPLAQNATPALAKALLESGYRVMIETGGSLPIETLPREVHIIMDIKCPGSKMAEHNLWTNLKSLKATDEIKFVLTDRKDFDWALEVINEHQLIGRVRILFSPAFGLLTPKQLSEWLVEERKPIRLNLQQHKYIWHPTAKGV